MNIFKTNFKKYKKLINWQESVELLKLIKTRKYRIAKICYIISKFL